MLIPRKPEVEKELSKFVITRLRVPRGSVNNADAGHYPESNDKNH